MSFETEIAERSLRADELVRQGRAQLRQVVLDGHRHGLSQRRIAALTGRSQPEVGRLLREIGGPARTWMTARGAAEAIKGELGQGDDDFALRTLIGAINDFRGLRDPAEIWTFCGDRAPPVTGDGTRSSRPPWLRHAGHGGHRAEVDPPGAPEVLVVPVRRWRSAGRPHHGAHAHRLLTSGYLAGRVGLPDGVGRHR